VARTEREVRQRVVIAVVMFIPEKLTIYAISYHSVCNIVIICYAVVWCVQPDELTPPLQLRV